jgi:hypothetical protein
MSEKEARFEPVEDALFALMMEEFMEQQGKELLELNEKLKGEPEDGSLTASKERCQRAIDRYFKKQEAPRRRKSLKTIGRVLIAAVLAMVLMTATAFAVSEPFRVYLRNIMIEITDAELTVSNNGDTNLTEEQALTEENYVPQWMPEGFEETICLVDDTEILYEFTNTNEDSARIYVDVTAASMTLACDEVGVQTVAIGDHTAYMVAGGDRCEIIWVDEERNLTVNVFSEGGVDPEITLKVAENLSD